MKLKRSFRSYLPLILFIFVATATFTFFVTKNPEGTSAASLANFKPGNIISDYTMSNYNSMSEADIQNFLKSKNSCNDTRMYLNSQYHHVKDGHFVCLADETFGDGVDYGDSAPNGQSAAHIIWQAAQDYKINPQVLIVLLQKEQGLITDTFPNSIQYRSATGYGCPDTAACNTKYYGFKNQVRNAAALFRTVLNGGWTNYPVGNNYIQYNPNADCGGSVVYIENLATSSLYRYTPYQPNAGALAAGYGTAACGAYGNRNFYLYFSDWFGDPTSDGWPSLAKILSSMNKPNKEDSELNLKYHSYVQHYGWLDWADGGDTSGTTGYSLRLEALAMKLQNEYLGGIEYRTHLQSYGWGEYKSNGEISGAPDESLRMEAVQIRLTGDASKLYDIYYRTHVQGIGWMDWAKNDEISGTTGQSKRIEALQVKIVRKHSSYGPKYLTHVQGIGWMDWAKNGETAGTTGQSRRVEAIEIKLSDDLANKY
ncbi:hypothetical protein IJI94_03700, partial [Candidatus Saccharibacteria bacterium]|nr:hypothetical protein [Candidatus Saccharibacteria bacterium]